MLARSVGSAYKPRIRYVCHDCLRKHGRQFLQRNARWSSSSSPERHSHFSSPNIFALSKDGVSQAVQQPGQSFDASSERVIPNIPTDAPLPRRKKEIRLEQARRYIRRERAVKVDLEAHGGSAESLNDTRIRAPALTSRPGMNPDDPKLRTGHRRIRRTLNSPVKTVWNIRYRVPIVQQFDSRGKGVHRLLVEERQSGKDKAAEISVPAIARALTGAPKRIAEAKRKKAKLTKIAVELVFTYKTLLKPKIENGLADQNLVPQVNSHKDRWSLLNGSTKTAPPNVIDSDPITKKSSKMQQEMESAQTAQNTANMTPDADPQDQDAPKLSSRKSGGTTTNGHAAIKGRGRGVDTSTSQIRVISAKDLHLTPLEIAQRPVPRLSHDLQRVLFNPGVYQLQEPRSRVFNFDPYLQTIMPVSEFNFEALGDYVTSSKDVYLRELAIKYNTKYFGSTSSMTSVLSHFHFLLSQWRPLNVVNLSRRFEEPNAGFSAFSKKPTAVFLRYNDGTYAIDADNEFSSVNILMELGKSLEKLLTLSPAEYERYRKTHKAGISKEEQKMPESYHFTSSGDFMMRSQLDAHDPRLPGTGMFDLKTRAVVSIRMSAHDHEFGTGYQINSRFGKWESYEREYYDMIRSAFLKYSLQVRMGRMDGIFVAFHNVERIFGFQYISLPEMDLALHGDPSVGDQEFKLSLKLWKDILDRATEKFPGQSLRLHFETREAVIPFMYIFAEPVTLEEISLIQKENQDHARAFSEELSKLDVTPSESDGDLPESASSQNEESSEASSLEHPSIVFTNNNLESDSSRSGTLEDVSAPEHQLGAPEIPTGSRPDSPAVGTPKEMLGFTLVIRNKVNNTVVDRPTDLQSPFDLWEVEYNLSELKQDQIYDLYSACRRRRMKSTVTDETASVDWSSNGYMRQLREIIQKSKRRMERKQEAEKGLGRKILYPEDTWTGEGD